MIGWQRHGCLDPEVWGRFLSSTVVPAVMPAPSAFQEPQHYVPLEIDYLVFDICESAHHFQSKKCDIFKHSIAIAFGRADRYWATKKIKCPYTVILNQNGFINNVFLF